MYEQEAEELLIWFALVDWWEGITIGQPGPHTALFRALLYDERGIVLKNIQGEMD